VTDEGAAVMVVGIYMEEEHQIMREVDERRRI
jgi:hypothetical protein